MLIAVDNVLLDLLVPIDDDPGVLERYQIKPNSQCLAEEKHMPLVKDALAQVAAGKAQAACGGVLSNSLRAGSWWFKKEGCKAPRRIMFGRVGQDDAGKRLREDISVSGVEPFFDEAREEGTGVCCCFLASKARTMLTYLGASKTLHLDGASGHPTFDKRMEPLKAAECKDAVVVHVSGFYVQADPEGAAAMAAWCKRHSSGKMIAVFAMTVGAEWCTELKSVQAAARSADFTFANEAEILHMASATAKPAPPDYEAAMQALAEWKGHGWIIGTRGAKGVGYINASDSQVRMLPVPPVPPEEFKDDVGAGDSFMGGFTAALWQRLQGLVEKSRKRKLEDASLVDDLTDTDIQDAVRAGISAAAACIRCSGCQFPA